MDVSSSKPALSPIQTVSRPAGGLASASQQAQQSGSVAPISSESVAVVASKAQATEVSRSEVEDAVASIQEFVQSVKRDLNFAVDDGSGQVVVKVTDPSSGDLIRQIPSEEALQLAENLTEVRSLLFKAEA